MKTKSTLVINIILVVSLGIWSACGSDNQNSQSTENEEISVGFEETSDDFGQTFYRIPSPEEMFSFVQRGQLNYTNDLLNPTENLGKYMDTKSKELNFGIYSADLAYTAAFHEFQGSLQYINAVKQLADAIEISSVFNEGLNERIKHIFDNSDTLINVTNSAYYRIVNFLEANDRGKTLALISTGGWLESIYIVVNLMDDYQAESATMQQIADQKLTYENLILYLEQYNDDPNVKSTIKDLSKIGQVFAELKVEQMDVQPTEKNDGDVILLGTSSKITMSEDQFSRLKKEIVNARNKITLNDTNL